MTTRRTRGPVFLTGYMGCGKTTLGTALAQRLGGSCRFVDLDQWIEEQAGMTVREIFAAEGEEGFRHRETLALHTLAGQARRDPGVLWVIACGGGTPCQGDNMDFMTAHGTTVWLDVPVPRLVERLMAAHAARPLLAGLKTAEDFREFITQNLGQRSPYYSRAALRFDSSHLESPAEINDTVDTFIQIL